jgi:hypothetical protein
MRSLVVSAALLAAVAVHAPRPAAAFCGFFVSGSDQKLVNSASQVVLMRKGNRTVMTMSNNYQGPPADFAMVVPVPVVLKKEQVRTLSPTIFSHIEQLTAPRLVEYWEQDPCGPGLGAGYGKGGARGAPAKAEKEDSLDRKDSEYHVKVEAEFKRGEYEVVILSAEDSTGLDGWLRHNGYQIPQGAEEAMRPYVQSQQKFFVAKVDVKKVKLDPKTQKAVLSPLQFSFEAPELRLPVRLGLLNAGAAQDLIVYVLHPQKRFEVANYPNVFIPTNIELQLAAKKVFHAFYAELFDETLRKANNRAVVTEYSWDTASCDPCPGPPLEEGEVATLGASRLGGTDSGWVVTRLHTRYSKDTLSEDLVFRAARSMAGGRAEREDGGGPQTAKRDEQNNFQGRYIVRHHWSKKITCDSPTRNQWGGPPDGRQEPIAARGLDEVTRGEVKLAELVRASVPAIGLTRGARKPTPTQ